MSIAKEWAEFAEKCLPKGCSIVQYREMRRAFYGGVLTGCLELQRIADQDLPEEEEERALEALNRELLNVKDAVGRGEV